MKRPCPGTYRVPFLAGLALLLWVLASGALGGTGGTAGTTPTGSPAEWQQARHILMHTPGEELFLGVIHPAAALFERTFSIDRAAAEHRAYIRELEREGARVSTVVATLLDGTLDGQGNPIAGPALTELRQFARQFVTVDASALAPDEQAAQARAVDEAIAHLHPHELVRAILQQPTIHLRATGTNTGYAATYTLDPVMNLYFCRDQVITTAKGVVIGRMQAEQRAAETRIIQFVLHKLGVQPMAQITAPGTLEGGDFIPAGNLVFIGQGLRTNAEAIRQLLEQEVFGAARVAVVKDHWQDQSQMHLDTYFNLIGPRLAVLVETRVRTDQHTPDEQMRLTLDLYERQPDGGYRQTIADGDFQEFLSGDLHLKLVPVPAADQQRYGANFLTVRAGHIIGVDGVSQAYKNRLRDAGVRATWIDFRNLTGGYGAAHCVTQVLRRAPK